ncbi:hypothetical protein [Brucella thiophenivorans]|uniref:Putative membrane protein n=1 Tax=Brucella thiophenivorans TaxID=571255 RepID=A0A256FW48_9HYPH|nr:hypothetical protein [Brucella thiophenivorans]OYR18936.1 putative membrane protein [Brucella thiophenivorans]
MSVRFQIAALISLMVNAVIFGIGTIAVLSIPALNEDAKFWLPVAVVTSIVLSPGISWLIAPRLRNRYWQSRQSANKV